MGVYLVEGKDGSKRLIETRNKSVAIQFVAESDYTAKVLNTSQLVREIQDGLKVETIPTKEKPTEAGETDGIPSFAKASQATKAVA